MNRNHLILLLITFLLSLGFIGIIASETSTDGMQIQGGSHVLFILGSIGFFVLAAIYLIGTAVFLCLRAPISAIVVFGCAILAAAGPLVSWVLLPPLTQMADTRYIDRFGRDALRTEAAELVSHHQEMNTMESYFGKMLAAEDTPPTLRQFSRQSGLEVNEEGVVYRTAGLGSWRGGYLVTPIHSDHVPEGGREVVPGFYYVVSRGDWENRL